MIELQQRIAASRVLEGASRLDADSNRPVGTGRSVGRTGQRRHEWLNRLAWRESAIAEPVGQSRRMAEQPADRDAVVVELGLRQGPAREIRRHRRVEVERPGLDQGHHPPSRDPFAHGGDLEQRVAIDRLAGRREVLVEHLAVLDQDEGDIAATGPVDLCDGRFHEGARVARRRQWLTPPAFQRSRNENGGPDRQGQDGAQHDHGNSAHLRPHDVRIPAAPGATEAPTARPDSSPVRRSSHGRWPRHDPGYSVAFRGGPHANREHPHGRGAGRDTVGGTGPGREHGPEGRHLHHRRRREESERAARRRSPDRQRGHRQAERGGGHRPPRPRPGAPSRRHRRPGPMRRRPRRAASRPRHRWPVRPAAASRTTTRPRPTSSSRAAARSSPAGGWSTAASRRPTAR